MCYRKKKKGVERTMVYDIAYRHKDGTLVTNRVAKNIVSII